VLEATYEKATPSHGADSTTPPSAPRSTLRPTSRGKIIGSHPALQSVMGTIDRIAASRCTVLVTGESGTGKELVVAAIHDASPRNDGPLVAVNCGAIPENLLESELFGHVKGAFTGATANRQGFVAAAEGGTLFLDEVGELPLALQVKLLRVLQHRQYTPVGETRSIPCDVRVVAATNRDLTAWVREGRFREDLYYRLNVIHLHLPALRERPDDIPALAAHFFEQARERCGRPELEGLATSALAALARYDWPGNIRELENTLERAALLAPGPLVEASDLPTEVKHGSRDVSAAPELPEDGIDLRAAVESYENGLIRQALARTGYNKNRAARLLGINRTTLVEMLKRKRLV